MAEKEITVQGVDQGFSQLKEALKSAVSQSSKNGGQCIVWHSFFFYDLDKHT